MQKIVINKEYGGYSLSLAAIQRLAELRGETLYYFTHLDPKASRSNYRESDIHWNVNYSITAEQYADTPYCSIWLIPDPDSYSKEERDGMFISCYQYSDDRSNPLLIQVVEELGKAAGDSLKIVEIPNGVDWMICEYDGLEHIAEKHRIWS